MHSKIESASPPPAHAAASHVIKGKSSRHPPRRSRRSWIVGTALLAQLALTLAIGQDRTADPPSQGVRVAPQDASETPAAATKAATGTAWTRNLAEWKALKERDPADNSFCNVCHSNYEGEKLVKIHLDAGVGCETCHGVSDEHSEDEDNITPPEVMFDKEKILPFCTSCHRQEDLVHEEEHQNLFKPEVETTKTCTDCHAKEHRLKVRTRRWNKDTGKLEWYDGVRMMQERDDGK